MNKIFGFTLLFIVLTVLTSCNNSKLTERVQVTNDVSVLLAQNFKKSKLTDGKIHYQSKIGTADLNVSLLENTKFKSISLDEIKKGMEINIAYFLKPLKGKLLSMKDTIIGNVVKCDFKFETENSEISKYGEGKFIVKDNNFIGFTFQSSKPETKSNEALRKSFFESINIE